MNNLENIPACLRVIARRIEKGEIEADVGVLTLRKRGASRPKVFGFGPVGSVEPVRECGRAVMELMRLAGVPAPTAEQTAQAVKALERIAG